MAQVTIQTFSVGLKQNKSWHTLHSTLHEISANHGSVSLVRGFAKLERSESCFTSSVVKDFGVQVP